MHVIQLENHIQYVLYLILVAQLATFRARPGGQAEEWKAGLQEFIGICIEILVR